MLKCYKVLNKTTGNLNWITSKDNYYFVLVKDGFIWKCYSILSTDTATSNYIQQVTISDTKGHLLIALEDVLTQKAVGEYHILK